ncbi:MFS transporter [Kocuria carniphila]|uniref:MFS transporter n=1 Tax=Kocuria carniphila TaxID=262208 RepID=UPI0034CEF0F6
MAGIVLVALSLRGPIIAPTPVITTIQDDIGLSSVAAGLLTGLPVLLFAVITPAATAVIRRAGPEAAILLCLAGILVGTVIRSVGSAALVLTGTVIIGAAIAVGNIVVPVIIRRDVPGHRVSVVTAAYTAALNVGSMITALGTAPLAAVVGWRWALAIWGALALVGLMYWLGLARRRSGTAASDAAGRRGGPQSGELDRETDARESVESAPGISHVRRISWLLSFAFCGQAMAYYSVTAWLPALLADTRGLSLANSGASASLFQVAAVIGAFGVPLLTVRAPTWVPVAVIGALWIMLPIGLLLAPGWYLLWSIIGGAAQGGGFTAIFSIVARVARSSGEATSMSARVQGIGYLAATVGPPVLGGLNTATGGWTAPLLLVLVATLVSSVGGVLAALSSGRAGRK